MSAVNAMQMAAVVSVNVIPPVNAMQLAAVFSVTTIPAVNVYQLSATFSISPGRPYKYAPQKMTTNGPLNVLVDAPKLGQKNGS